MLKNRPEWAKDYSPGGARNPDKSDFPPVISSSLPLDGEIRDSGGCEVKPDYIHGG